MNNKIALILITILVFLKFAVVPWFDWVAETSADIEQKERSYYKLSNLSEKQESTLKNIEQMKGFLKPFEAKTLPSNRAQLTKKAFDHMSALGKKYDVTVRNQRLGELQPGELPYVPHKMVLEGNAIGIQKFLKELEYGKYLFVIAEASVVTMPRVPNNLSLNLTIYLAVEEEA